MEHIVLKSQLIIHLHLLDFFQRLNTPLKFLVKLELSTISKVKQFVLRVKQDLNVQT